MYEVHGCNHFRNLYKTGNKAPNEDKAFWGHKLFFKMMVCQLQTSLLSTIKKVKKKHSTNQVNAQRHTLACVFTPAKVDWINESHGLDVYNTALKGSFHNGPR